MTHIGLQARTLLKLMPKLFGAVLLCCLAQTSLAQNMNWRGTIASFDGKVLGVTLRDGQSVLIDLPEGLPISATDRFSMEDVKLGMVLGVTTMNRADGSKVAIGCEAHFVFRATRLVSLRLAAPIYDDQCCLRSCRTQY